MPDSKPTVYSVQRGPKGRWFVLVEVPSREQRYREAQEAERDARSTAERGTTPALLKVYEGARLKVCELWEPAFKRWQQADAGGKPLDEPASGALPVFTIKACPQGNGFLLRWDDEPEGRKLPTAAVCLSNAKAIAKRAGGRIEVYAPDGSLFKTVDVPPPERRNLSLGLSWYTGSKEAQSSGEII